MAVEHMVWIRFGGGVSGEAIEGHLSALRGLAETVPGIMEIKAGENFTDRANGFKHGLSVTLESKEALEIYAGHPAHVAVATALKRDAELMAMDFEF